MCKKSIIINLWFLVFLIFLTSCFTPKKVLQTKKQINGNWTLADVSYEGIKKSYVNVTAFDEASIKCFEDSQWYFLANNSTGSYTLSGKSGCSAKTQPIVWKITDEENISYFWFKKIGETQKAKHVVSGYKLKVVELSDAFFKIQQEILFEGKRIKIVYKFQKSN